MFLDALLDSLSGNNTRPNRFTIGMGKLIRAAREEAGFSQRELAEKIYRRQAALSDMENGKMEPDASTLFILSFILNKPLSYFFPEPWKRGIKVDDLTELQTELLQQAKKLSDYDLKRLIAQAKALANLSEK